MGHNKGLEIRIKNAWEYFEVRVEERLEKGSKIFLKLFTMVRLQTDNGTSLSYKCDKLDKWVSKMGMKDMLEGKA